ncbi:LexA family transcriptional regulator [Salinisphaera orenii]|uniref:LexA family transcriptional regulator n=1 Tax=Salinisphaera orenii TaxID=856731 RepID=UPI0013A5F784
MRFQTIGQRVKYAIEMAGKDVTQVARESSMARSTLYDLIGGRQTTSKKLPELARATGFNIEWLQSEVGLEEAGADDQLRSPSADNIDPTELAPKLYPVLDWVNAGSWNEVAHLHESGDIEHWHPAQVGIRCSEYSFWLEVQGRSMISNMGDHSFPPGMLILVDPIQKECVTGDYVVAMRPDTDQATFKRLNFEEDAVYLEPLNEQYRPIRVDYDCEIVGKVVGFMGSL